MKYYLYADEEWPVCYAEVEPRAGARSLGEIELTPEERGDYLRVMQQYDDWQARLREKTGL